MRKTIQKILILMLLVGGLLPSVTAQSIKVSGKVADINGEPIPGATVMVKGTDLGITTDVDGMYNLPNVPSNATLVISFVGMKRQEVAVNGATTINVTLETMSEQMEELVVIGYGVQRREALTGTVNTIKTETIANRTSSSLTSTLQGVTPGVTIKSSSGDLGNDMGSINVRGRGNLGSSAPLFVIDGVIAGEGDFQRINPSDIESISILKDAAASAIYGSRAAYGVFVVTTKTGKDGKMSISYNASFGLQSPTILQKKLNSIDYAMLLNEANENSGRAPAFSQEQLAIIRDGSNPDLYPNTDWLKIFYKPSAPIQEHNVSVSGSGKTRYYVSGSFMSQGSLVRYKNLERYSFRSNTESELSDMLTVGTNISFIRDQYTNDGGSYLINEFDRMTPLTVARHSDGTWGSIFGGQMSETSARGNPLRKVEEGGWEQYYTNRFIGTVNATLKPAKGLVIKGIISYTDYYRNLNKFDATVEPVINFITKEPIVSTAVTTNQLRTTWDKQGSINAQAFATYDLEVGSHIANLMVGTQLESYRTEQLMALRKNFPSNELGSIDGGSASAADLGNSGSINNRAFLSQFGRLSYSYKRRYLLGADIRFDQSSQFAPDRRLGVFPSLSAAWVISREDFMQKAGWVNNLKLRASWGQLGNVNNVGNYDYLNLLATGLAKVVGGVKVNGIWLDKVPNSLLTWETVTMTNVGVDFSIFNGLFDLQVDAFNKKTTDILVELPLPLEFGSNSGLPINGGVVTNKGIEMIASHRGKIGNFGYGVSGNLSKIWNKIISLNGLTGDRINQDPFILQVGQPVGAFFGYVAEGLFKDEEDVQNHAKQFAGTGPGDIKYKDLNKDGIIDSQDRTIIGNDVPYFTYGLQVDANYKGFDFSAIGQGVANVKVALDAEAAWAFFNGATAREYHLKRWTESNPNPNADYPKVLPTASNTRNQENSSFWLYDASYFRVKNISLGYTLPSNISEKIRMTKLRFYLNATNVLTFRGDKRMMDFDPEMPTGRGSYPLLKVYSLGVNLTF